MVDAAKTLGAGEIAPGMPVVGNDQGPVGTVLRVEGEYLALAKGAAAPAEGEAAEAAGGFVPLSTVAGLEGGVVRLTMPAAQVIADALVSEDEMAQRLDLDPKGTAEALGQPDESGPHGSRAKAHGGPKTERQQGKSGGT